MTAFKQYLWAEWREQRGNLLGLWAGLVLLIAALGFFGGGNFINHHLAPMWFAGLGCLAFTLTVTPRVFAHEDRASQKGFVRRSPGGAHVSFMAKALFLNIALALTALIPMAATLAVIYWLDPRTIETIGKVENGWANVAVLILTWHSVPLVLLAWGLPWRWSLVFSGIAALVIGASMYGAFLDAGAFQRDMSEFGLSDGSVLTKVAMVLAPWVAAWVGYTLRKDTGHVRRGLACVGALALVHAPAWGYYVPRGLDFVALDTTADSLHIRGPLLSPDKRSIFVAASNGKTEAGGWRPPHALRIDVGRGSYTDLGYGSFRTGRFSREQYEDDPSFPTVTSLLSCASDSSLFPLARWAGSFATVDPNTGLEPNAGNFVRSTRPPLPHRVSAKDLGLPSEWRTWSTTVGLGYLMRNHREVPCEWAIYDIHRKRVFFERDLPMSLRSNLIVLPDEWLIAPRDLFSEWRQYDPDTGTLSTREDLSHLDTTGPVLLNGKVLMNRQGFCYLYDPVLREKQWLTGGRAPGSELILQGRTRLLSTLRAPTIDWYQPKLVTVALRPGARTSDTSLGWLRPSDGSLTWFPWHAGNHIFGATDEHTVLYREGDKRICSLDLATGETLTIFPSSVD